MRRIADKREFREDNDVGRAFGGRTGGLQDKRGVPCEVADGGVDLAERDAHGRFYFSGVEMATAALEGCP